MAIRGIRGATTAQTNNSQAILSATIELLSAILAANPTLEPKEIASAIFTVTNDLDADYPAKAARKFGWTETPLMCAREIPVPGSIPSCIRVLIHWNTNQSQSAIRHVYLGETANLRPDIKQADV